MTKELELAPPDAAWTVKTDPRRCWMCGYYSFKAYANEDDTTGKCFRDHKDKNKVYYVNGLMTCPGFTESVYVRGEVE